MNENVEKASVIKFTPLTLLVIYRGMVITWAEYIEVRDSY